MYHESLNNADGIGLSRQLIGGILSAVGNTPLVKLEKLSAKWDMQVYAKLEFLNPGGSTKDRPAIEMIREGIRLGKITGNTTVIESSSGNLALGLAQVCGYLGIPFICVVDPKTEKQNLRLLELYGARVEMVTVPDSATGEYLAARIGRVRELLQSGDRYYWTNQYANPRNSAAHHNTAAEIYHALRGRCDYIFCGVSTCGTLRGCAEYLRSQAATTQIVAVDALGSVLFGVSKCKRLIPGHGASRVPELFEPGLEDFHIEVSDGDCVVGCRLLLEYERILAGGSSGGVIAGVEKCRARLKSRARCVVILCDRGERYINTIYSDDWVRQNTPECLERLKNL